MPRPGSPATRRGSARRFPLQGELDAKPARSPGSRPTSPGPKRDGRQSRASTANQPRRPDEAAPSRSPDRRPHAAQLAPCTAISGDPATGDARPFAPRAVQRLLGEEAGRKLPHRRPPPQGSGARAPAAAPRPCPAGRDAAAGRGLPEAEGGRRPQPHRSYHDGRTPQRRSRTPRSQSRTIPAARRHRRRWTTSSSPRSRRSASSSRRVVREPDGGSSIVAGDRRVKAAIAAGLDRIDVLVCDADEATDAMRAVSENLIRASMTSVDIWRAVEGWKPRVERAGDRRRARPAGAHRSAA